MKRINTMATKAAVMVTGIVATVSTAFASAPDFSAISNPIVELINALINPALAIVGALGALFCIILGVKYAKAEEPQDREKAKSHLKNALIGFVLIFVMMLALKLLMPILQNWVTDQIATATNF